MEVFEKIKSIFIRNYEQPQFSREEYNKSFMEKYADTKFILLDITDYKRPPMNSFPMFVPEIVHHDAKLCSYGTILPKECVIPSSPEALLHCVKNLTRKEKLNWQKNRIGSFNCSLGRIANDAKYGSKDEWYDAKIQSNIHLNQNYWEEEPRILTAEALSTIDWTKVGRKLKQRLPSSYSSKPTNVEIYNAPDGTARVKLTMQSKTTPSYRILSIRFGDIVESINGSYFKERSELSEVWNRCYSAIMNQKIWEMSTYDNPKLSASPYEHKTKTDEIYYAMENESFEKQ